MQYLRRLVIETNNFFETTAQAPLRALLSAPHVEP